MKLYIDVFDKSCIVMFYERIFVIQRVLTMQKSTFESSLIYNSQDSHEQFYNNNSHEQFYQ